MIEFVVPYHIGKLVATRSRNDGVTLIDAELNVTMQHDATIEKHRKRARCADFVNDSNGIIQIMTYRCSSSGCVSPVM